MKRVIFSLVVVAAIAISAVVVTSCGNVQAKSGSVAKAENWEYKQLDFNYDNGGHRQDFNSLGKEGWELVSVTRGPHCCTANAYFKRRLP